jgi:hypothetical protein
MDERGPQVGGGGVDRVPPLVQADERVVDQLLGHCGLASHQVGHPAQSVALGAVHERERLGARPGSGIGHHIPG